MCLLKPKLFIADIHLCRLRSVETEENCKGQEVIDRDLIQDTQRRMKCQPNSKGYSLAFFWIKIDTAILCRNLNRNIAA